MKVRPSISKHFADRSFNSPLKQTKRLVPDGYSLDGKVLKPGQAPKVTKKKSPKKEATKQIKMQDSVTGMTPAQRREAYKADPNSEILREVNIFPKDIVR